MNDRDRDMLTLRMQLALLVRDYREQFPRLSNDQKAAYLADISRIEREIAEELHR